MWMKTRRKLFYDLFTTMIDNSWPVLILIIFVMYFLVWFLFAGVWYTIYLTEGGKIFGRQHQFLHDMALSATKCVSDVTCVEGISDFTSSVLMSIELMQTIGYGQRATTEKVSRY